MKQCTRMQAFECKKPKAKSPDYYEMKHFKLPQYTINPCESLYMPPKDLLENWKSELTNASKLAADFFCYETSFGRYNLDTVHASLNLYKFSEIAKQVSQELD